MNGNNLKIMERYWALLKGKYADGNGAETDNPLTMEELKDRLMHLNPGEILPVRIVNEEIVDG